MENTEKRIGNDTTEAFALLVFSNNYKAWLYEEKSNHGKELLTEYESVEEDSIVDTWLFKQEFNLEEETGDLMISVPTSLSYKRAVKARQDWQGKLKLMPICSEMKRSWEDMADTGVDENVPNPGEISGKKLKETKKRKLMKTLKKYTGQAEKGERKFKGWSDNGHKAFEEWTVSIKQDVGSGRYTRWENAVWEVQAKRQEARRSEVEPIKKYAVDRSVVWEL
jgi:hypothetical protein